MNVDTFRHWTNHEEVVIREHYIAGGVEACLPLLSRSRGAIYQRACRMKLVTTARTGCREHWPRTPKIDAEIVLAHQKPLHSNAVKELAVRIGRPRWWVSSRARQLGLKTPRFKEAEWSEVELELLHETAHLSLKIAQVKFKKAGFQRSECSIHVKRKRAQTRPDDNGYFNAQQLCNLLGVDNKTVTRWIRLGELKAAERGTKRTPQQGGDQWWIREKHLRAFVIEFPLRVDLKKIPDSSRTWFIQLLSGKAA